MAQLLKLVKTLSWEVYFKDFLLSKQIQGCRPRTLKDYRYHIPRLFESIEDLENFAALRSRVNEYFAQDVAPGTFNIRRKYIIAFCSYLVEEGAIPKSPITFPVRKDEPRARNIEPGVLERLLNLPNRKTFAGLRNYCLILLSLDTGIRPGEALQLTPADFNLESSQVTVRKEASKTGTTRTLPLSALTVTHITRLVRHRPSLWKDAAPVFCSQDGKPMETGSWSHIMTKYSKKLGARISAYDLRHAFALLSLRSGMTPFALQRILGHSDLSMTRHYLSLTQSDLKREHETTSPLLIVTKKRVRLL